MGILIFNMQTIYMVAEFEIIIQKNSKKSNNRYLYYINSIYWETWPYAAVRFPVSVENNIVTFRRIYSAASELNKSNSKISGKWFDPWLKQVSSA